MPGSVRTRFNESPNQTIKTVCNTCAGKTLHKVLALLEKMSSESDNTGYEYYWSERFQLIQCNGCESVSFRIENANSEDRYYDEWSGEYVYNTIEVLYPPRLEGLNNPLGEDSKALPADVLLIYNETLKALENELPILAGIGLRAILETICKEKQCIGINLFEKITDLKLKGITTSENEQILHKIRTLGNKSAHEVKPHTLSELRLALEVATHILKDVYILPKKAKDTFKI